MMRARHEQRLGAVFADRARRDVPVRAPGQIQQICGAVAGVSVRATRPL